MWRTGRTPMKIWQETFCHHYNSVSYNQHGGTLSHITYTFISRFVKSPSWLWAITWESCVQTIPLRLLRPWSTSRTVYKNIIMLSNLNNNWSWFTVKALLSPTKIPPPPLHVNKQQTSVRSQLTVCSNKPTHWSSDTVWHFQLNASRKDFTFRNIVMINS